MKKTLVFAAMMLGAWVANAQSLSTYFTVGPYEVEYVNEDDINYRLREGVDLYKYYNLSKDTIINQTIADKTNDVKSMRDVFSCSLITDFCVYSKPRYTTKWGVEIGWKHQLAHNYYLNVDLSASLTKATAAIEGVKFGCMEIALPVSVEWNKLAESSSSVYFGVGIVPAFASTSNTEHYLSYPGTDQGDKSGFSVIPRVDFGSYVPVGSHLLRLGLFGMYRRDLSDDGPYDYLLGRTCLGASVGIIF